MFQKSPSSKTNDYEQGQISGIYMIKELNHHYDTDGSFTTMKLVRDTYGTTSTGGDSPKVQVILPLLSLVRNIMRLYFGKIAPLRPTKRAVG